MAFLLIVSGRALLPSSAPSSAVTHQHIIPVFLSSPPDSSLAGGDDNSVPQKLLILDARSYTAAVANRAKGGGCECEGQGSHSLETVWPFLLLPCFYRMPLFCFVLFSSIRYYFLGCDSTPMRLINYFLEKKAAALRIKCIHLILNHLLKSSHLKLQANVDIV